MQAFRIFQIFPWTIEDARGTLDVNRQNSGKQQGGEHFANEFQLDFNWIHSLSRKIRQNNVSAGKVPLNAGKFENCRHFPETPISTARSQGNAFTRDISPKFPSTLEDTRGTFRHNRQNCRKTRPLAALDQFCRDFPGLYQLAGISPVKTLSPPRNRGK